MYPNEKKSKPIPPGTFVTTPLRSIYYADADKKKSSPAPVFSLKKSEKPPKPPKPEKPQKPEKTPKPPKPEKPPKLPKPEKLPKPPKPPKEKKPLPSTLLLVLAILFALLSVLGITFGVLAFMKLKKKDSVPVSITQFNPDGTSETLIIKDKTFSDESLEITVFAPEEEPEPEPEPEIIEVINPEEYVYVGEWNLKIKIPENLGPLRYTYASFHDTGLPSSDGSTLKTSSLCVSAAIKNPDSVETPSFVMKSSGVCMTKNIGTAADPSSVAPVYRIESGTYYFETPQTYYGTSEENALEEQSIRATLDWLSDESARSLIEEPEEESEEKPEEEPKESESSEA